MALDYGKLEELMCPWCTGSGAFYTYDSGAGNFTTDSQCEHCHGTGQADVGVVEVTTSRAGARPAPQKPSLPCGAGDGCP